MMQKRVVAEYCSMILRRAACASIVIESASSNMQIWRGGILVRPSGCLAIFLWANFLTFSRTTAIPRSSDAFNSITLCLKKSCPKSSFANARIVEVFPVPGGPWSTVIMLSPNIFSIACIWEVFRFWFFGKNENFEKKKNLQICKNFWNRKKFKSYEFKFFVINKF